MYLTNPITFCEYSRWYNYSRQDPGTTLTETPLEFRGAFSILIPSPEPVDIQPAAVVLRSSAVAKQPALAPIQRLSQPVKGLPKGWKRSPSVLYAKRHSIRGVLSRFSLFNAAAPHITPNKGHRRHGPSPAHPCRHRALRLYEREFSATQFHR